MDRTEFIIPGNGIYPTDPIVSIANPHGPSNPLCCALHPNDSILATGGADSTVSLSFWGAALQPSSSSSSSGSNAYHVKCNAPVITLAFAQSPLLQNILAVGCMDGSVDFIAFSQTLGGAITLKAQSLQSVDASGIKHNKYIKSLAWSISHSTPNILVSASADGVVHVSRVLPQKMPSSSSSTQMDDDAMMITTDEVEDAMDHVKIEKVTSFYLQGAVETLCFLQGGNVLCLYERDTPYLTYFDLADGNKQSRHSLNGSKFSFDSYNFIYLFL